MSDEITGMTVICKYAPASADICIFRHFRFFPASLSLYRRLQTGWLICNMAQTTTSLSTAMVVD